MKLQTYHRHIIVLFAIAVFTVLLSSSVKALDTFPICLNTSGQNVPAASGDFVVWVDSRNGNSDIYGKKLSTGEEFAICTNSSVQLRPFISGNVVTWTDERSGHYTRDIYGFNLANRAEFPICTNTGEQNWSSISGNTVVWVDETNGQKIYGKDLSTN